MAFLKNSKNQARFNRQYIYISYLQITVWNPRLIPFSWKTCTIYKLLRVWSKKNRNDWHTGEVLHILRECTLLTIAKMDFLNLLPTFHALFRPTLLFVCAFLHRQTVFLPNLRVVIRLYTLGVSSFTYPKCTQ